MSEHMEYRILERQSVTADQVGEIMSLYQHVALSIGITVHTVGTAGSLKLQHSHSTDPGSFMDIATYSLTSAATSFEYVDQFLGYVRWITDGSVTGGPPIVTLTVFGKSG